MKKLIISIILALALGFITGFCFRDYHTRKGQAIEKKDISMDTHTLPTPLYPQENNWKDPECFECEDFGPV